MKSLQFSSDKRGFCRVALAGRVGVMKDNDVSEQPRHVVSRRRSRIWRIIVELTIHERGSPTFPGFAMALDRISRQASEETQ